MIYFYHSSFFSSPIISISRWGFFSAFCFLVMMKTVGLWQQVRVNCSWWMMAGSGLEKRAIVSTHWLELVLRELKAQVLPSASHFIDRRACYFHVEALHKNDWNERKVKFGMINTTLVNVFLVHWGLVGNSILC